MTRLYVIIAVLLCSSLASAQNITLPYTQNFNTAGDWADEISVETDCIPAAGRAETTHTTTGCYDGGCLHYVPPKGLCAGNGNGGIGGLGAYFYPGSTEMHWRFLIKFGPDYANNYTNIDKFLLSDWPTRTGILGLNCENLGAGNYCAFGVLDFDETYHFASPPNRGWLRDSLLKFSATENVNEWICVEYWINTATARTGVYLWKQDGTTYHITGVQQGATGVSQTGFYIQYNNGYGVASVNNYYLLDNLQISTSYIGPPAGFVGGTPPDTTPNQFTFTDVTGATRSTAYTSNTITVAGIDASTSVSITGGTYSKNGAAYTSAAGTAVLGDTFAVRVTSSASYSTAVSAILNIGGISDTYTVTTLADTVPAFLDNLSPSGVLACTSNPRNVTLSLTTDEAATARMSPTDTTYALMSDTFTTTGGTSHSEVKSLACGASYTYYVRTRDSANNDNPTSSTISFSIASPQIAGPGGFRIIGGKIGGN